MSEDTRDTPALGGELADYRRVILAVAVLGALLAWLFWDFFFRQFRFALAQQADWGHTLVIPLIAGYFVYLRRHELFAKPFTTTWWGFVPIVFGVAFYSVCVFGPEFLGHHNLRSVGVFATIFGVLLLFCGPRAMLWLWFPLLYVFVFGQTVSERLMQMVTFKLQDITAVASYYVLMIFGLDVEIQGNTLTLYTAEGEPRPLNVAEACSGMRMLMAFLALGVAMAYTGLERNWQRVLVVLLGVPTAIFVNILRVVTLSLLATLDKDLAGGDFHSFIGLVWLVPAFLIFLGVIWIVRNLITADDAAGAAT